MYHALALEIVDQFEKYIKPGIIHKFMTTTSLSGEKDLVMILIQKWE